MNITDVNNLALKHGYYFVINRDDDAQVLHIEIGKGYQNDDVTSTTVKVENGFINHYINGKLDTKRDANLVVSFSTIADGFINKLINQYTKSALVKRSGESLVPYYGKESL